MAKSMTELEPPNQPAPRPLPTFTVSGAEKRTGEEFSVVVCATTKTEAEQVGYKLGLFLSLVESTSESICDKRNLNEMQKLARRQSAATDTDSCFYLFQGLLNGQLYELMQCLPSGFSEDRAAAKILQDTGLEFVGIYEIPTKIADEVLAQSQSLLAALREYSTQLKKHKKQRELEKVRIANAPVIDALDAQRNVIRSVFKSSGIKAATKEDLKREFQSWGKQRGVFDYDEFEISWELAQIQKIMRSGRDFMALSAIEKTIAMESRSMKRRKNASYNQKLWMIF